MNLGELILALKPLLEEPAVHASKIVDLLERHQSLAEFEVARFYVSRAVVPVIEKQFTSIDPRERALAARGTGAMLARSDAARLLRRLVKDPDSIVRAAAYASVGRLGLDDVALPDTRFEVIGWRNGPFAPGRWNPSGWRFGLFGRRDPRTYARKDVHLKYTGKIVRRLNPPLADVDALVELLGLESEDALAPLMRAGESAGSPYVAFTIPKANGASRTIHAPRKELKAVQRTVLREILSRIPTHDACHGFSKGRSVVTNAAPHLRAKIVVRIDLIDFFPSIHYRRVLGLFRQYGYPPAVAAALAGLTTHRPVLEDGKAVWPGVLPQGAPTSPAIANLVCRRLDARLTALAKGAGAKYTRYADDLSFSFPAEPKLGLGRFLWWVDQICQAEGFHENPVKRRIYRRHTQQRVTGIVVNDKLTIPRARRRRFRALLAHCKKEGLAAMVKEQPGLRAELAGFVAYVHMVQPDLAETLKAQVLALEPGSAA